MSRTPASKATTSIQSDPQANRIMKGSKTFMHDLFKSDVQKMKKNVAIAIHGGAGNLVKLNLTPAQQEEYKKKLLETGSISGLTALLSLYLGVLLAG